MQFPEDFGRGINMLDRLVRYQPLLRFIKIYKPSSIIEIGSGSKGVGEFWSGKFVGVDVASDGVPLPHMNLILASGAELPFHDNSFEMSICMDVLEHVAPSLRAQVIHEALRVTKKHLIIGIPAGSVARESDHWLILWCKSKKIAIPKWLEEHMNYPYPDGSFIHSIVAGLSCYQQGNENVWLHQSIQQLELHPSILIRKCAYLLSSRLRCITFLILKLFHFPPYYREIFVISKSSTG